MSVRGIVLVFCIIAGACSGKIDYTPPYSVATPPNSKLVDLSRDELWSRLIPAISREFFVVNTIDRQSGLMNVSYSGDPQRYIDCGQISSTVSNARGTRNYGFSGASPSQTYEIMNSEGLFGITRTINLEGRINIVVEEVGRRQSRITASTRYVVNRQTTIRNTQGQSGTFTHTVNFNTGGSASFPSGGNSAPLICRANGRLEAEIIGLAG